MVYLLYSAAFLIALVGVKVGLELLAHISRYRNHIRQYPATRKMWGRVWRGTK